MSLSSLIMEKVNDVTQTNKFKLLKQQDDALLPNSPVTKDVSVQTSSILTSTDTSSISSQGATVQSNGFGSIVAHFGSASVQKNQSVGFQSKRILLRAYSDGNCLSNRNNLLLEIQGEHKENKTSTNANNGRILAHSPPTKSKLVDLSIQFWIL